MHCWSWCISWAFLQKLLNHSILTPFFGHIPGVTLPILFIYDLKSTNHIYCTVSEFHQNMYRFTRVKRPHFDYLFGHFSATTRTNCIFWIEFEFHQRMDNILELSADKPTWFSLSIQYISHGNSKYTTIHSKTVVMLVFRPIGKQALQPFWNLSFVTSNINSRLYIAIR